VAVIEHMQAGEHRSTAPGGRRRPPGPAWDVGCAIARAGWSSLSVLEEQPHGISRNLPRQRDALGEPH
jgi:hypothetical protein